MEAASDVTLSVTPGRQFYHPGHPKAIYTATITPTAVSGAATSITTSVILWNTTHGLTTGDTIIPVTNAPTGITNLSPYYVNVSDTTHFTMHLTLADALAGTNKVTISSSTAMTIRKLVYSNTFSYGMPTTSPVSGVAATTALGLVFNLSNAFSSAVCAPTLHATGLVDNGGTTRSDWALGFPSTVATKIITYANSQFGSAARAAASAADGLAGNWSQQGTTAFSVSFMVWGDLP